MEKIKYYAKAACSWAIVCSLGALFIMCLPGLVLGIIAGTLLDEFINKIKG